MSEKLDPELGQGRYAAYLGTALVTVNQGRCAAYQNSIWGWFRVMQGGSWLCRRGHAHIRIAFGAVGMDQKMIEHGILYRIGYQGVGHRA